MEVYKSKISHISGTSYREVYSHAKFIYKQIVSKTKRKPYIRSKYFKKEKIFLDLFWQHIHDKSKNDRLRRFRFYSCAIDLIENTMIKPVSKQNPNKQSETVHRFKGITREKNIFYVQIKEEKGGAKYFISVFPEE